MILRGLEARLDNNMQKDEVLIDLILPKQRKIIIALIQDAILVFAFTFLTATCAKIKIEIGPVPITGQTFAVLLSGILLGSPRAALSQVFYLFFGLAGVPLFARGRGIQYISSPTFGYIVGFIFAAFFVGKLAEKGWIKTFQKSISAMIAGNILIYAFGLGWLAKFIPPQDVLKVGLLPFLLGDAIKILLAASVAPLSWRFIKKFKGQEIK